ncbi:MULTISPECIES: hypothetical protein [Mycobacteriaceae]|uniref:Uncharacterized protein n=1 Tax=Mycolicibacterium parafortuitum TaxID=39692 RepID=A0ACC6MAV0_MYCPF|nr:MULTISPECIES: hypothetical protein [Mycobacteriaceae]MDZ5084056.1 hypothetical protein [Mycolicibacterium parafortuitum]GFM16877.1 transmembrane protein [Mycobacterium sp. PO1]GFM23773.1 transmembrane protein [Mycobacterium sp. PO2]
MGRTVAVIWHASFSLAAGVLYFFFVLPRTPELMGQTSHTLGTAMRIVTGALIGLAALPVVFTLLRTRKPEFGTPALALKLRTLSIVLHVLAGALIIGAAVSEIWLSLNTAGQWLFGIYGAAAAVALLGMFGFYLAYVAELPPPPPKPVKVKQRTSRRGSKDAEDTEDAEATEATEDTEDTDDPEGTEDADAETATDEPTVTAGPETAPESATTDSDATLQNRRPTGKGTLLGRRKKARGNVAVED